VDDVTDPPSAILFDADGVIQRYPEGSLERLAARLAVGDPARLLDELSAAEMQTLTGGMALRQAIEPVLRRWERSELIGEVLRSWFQIEVDGAAIDIIARLRRAGVRVYLATNQGTDRAVYMRRALGYGELFDHQFYSCELGLAKPDPAYFAAILTHLALPPRKVLFLDDNEANVVSARSVGLRAHLYPGYRTAALTAILEANGIAP
jgi:putative hydrolase of the HAD superfamily